MHYYSWDGDYPIEISKKQFDNLFFFIYNVLPPVARSFITKKRFKNDVLRFVVTHFYFDNIIILSMVRCF